MKNSSQNVAENEREFECSICGMKSDRKDVVWTHTKLVHIKQKTKMFFCRICPSEFSSSEARRLHEKSDHSDVEIECELCEKKFLTKDYLQRHKTQVHFNTEKEKCVYCGKQMTNLKLHMQAVHLKEKLHECAHCEKGFFYFYSLENSRVDSS